MKKPLPSQFKKKKKKLIRGDKLKILFISFQRSILSEDKQTFHWFSICLILFLLITEQVKPSVIISRIEPFVKLKNSNCLLSLSLIFFNS